MRAAVNLAAAFDEVHSAGCVVGDVSSQNVFVSSRAVVKLLDVDSFQVRAGGRQFFCDVATPLYVPPELIGKPLRGQPLTDNHDRFGLAVLVYQLLFVGRHPYAGVYSGREEPDPDFLIATFRFAQGPKAHTWGMTPPPHCPTLADLPPAAQVKMLRVLQERRFERVGGEETVSADVRVIAATNADLPALAADGGFRHDLLFRLNVFGIHLPPLRDRGDDLPLLVDHYVRRYGRELGKPARAVAPEALAALTAYRWPGNVRELQSVVKQCLLEMRGDVLLIDDLPAALRTPAAPPAPAGDGFGWDAFVAARLAAGSADLYAEALETMEREVLVRVLRHTAGNQLRAAKLLDITRGSLRTKIRSLGIAIGREVTADDDPPEAG